MYSKNRSKASAERKVVWHRFGALGTTINLKIVSEGTKEHAKAEHDLGEIEQLYHSYERQLSRFRDDSELSILNSSIGEEIQASEEMLHLAKKSLEFHKMSGGIFDPRIIEVLENTGYRESFEKGSFSVSNNNESRPEALEMDLADDLKIEGKYLKFGRRMDFSGIAKGYITDEVSEKLKKKGWNNFLIDSGGDIYASGANQSFNNWKIDIEGFSSKNLLIEVSDEAVATSGIGKRKWSAENRKFHHLINPKHPDEYSFDLRSVTVIAPNTEEADVFAKILFLLGAEKGLKWSEEKGTKSIFLNYEGGLIISSFAKNNLLLKE